MRRDRQTSFINRRTTQSIFRAFDFAAEQGTPLTHYIVIHLDDAPTHRAATAFEKIRHKYRDWQNYGLKKHGLELPPIYVFTMENPDGSPHVNWALHVPDMLSDRFKKNCTGGLEGSSEPEARLG